MMHNTQAPLQKMTPTKHLNELKKRLVWIVLIFLVASSVSMYFAANIYAVLLHPLVNVLSANHKIIFTGVSEAFYTHIRVAMYAAVAITTPFAMLHAYLYIAPALFKHEKLPAALCFISSIILFAMAFGLVYNYVMPVAWAFFLTFEMQSVGANSIPIVLEARVSEYLTTSLSMIMGFGIAFQLPILLIVLMRFNIVKLATLKRFRRYIIVIIFIIAAILTPPDVFSQIALAIPLYILYEITLIIGSFSQSAIEKRETNA